MIPDWMKGSSNPFSTVLIANRGEIAVRIIQAVKEASLKSIAIYSDSDNNSLHVEMADYSIHLPGETLTYYDGLRDCSQLGDKVDSPWGRQQ